MFTGSLFDKLAGAGDTLEHLLASENDFMGSISDLTEFSNLKRLWLVNNTFTGEFPGSVASLVKLGTWRSISI